MNLEDVQDILRQTLEDRRLSRSEKRALKDVVHHKFAVFDDELLLTGSDNWTRGAAEYNEENFVITDERRLLGPFAELFERLWNQFG